MKRVSLIALLVVACVALGFGSAFAWNNLEHVKQAPNGKGDLFIYPFYAAYQGTQTKLTIINTSRVYSVVAKIVFRSARNSEELLDFLIYLTPTDMWTGVVQYDATTAGALVYSTDESALTSLTPEVWSSATNPISQPLFNPTCSNDTDMMGYIEVIEGTSFDTTDAGWTSLVKTGENRDIANGPVAKSLVKRIYEASSSSIPFQPTTVPGLGYIDTRNILASYMEFEIPLANWSSLMRATMFADYNNLEYLNTGVETFIGQNARNTLGEVEAAMAKNLLAMPYYNSTALQSLHLFNFPTKQTVFDASCACVRGRIDSAFWWNKCTVSYGPFIYDWMENTPTVAVGPYSGGDTVQIPPMDEEVEILGSALVAAVGASYDHGWIDYLLYYGTEFQWSETCADGVTTVTYAGGIPTIGTVMHIGAAQLGMAESAWMDAMVTLSNPNWATSMVLPYYMYSN